LKITGACNFASMIHVRAECIEPLREFRPARQASPRFPLTRHQDSPFANGPAAHPSSRMLPHPRLASFSVLTLAARPISTPIPRWPTFTPARRSSLNGKWHYIIDP